VEPASRAISGLPDVLLVNPTAGGGRARTALLAIQEFAQQHNWNIEVCVTRSAEDLATQAKRAAQARHPRIFVLGGDGTFQVVVNTLSEFPDIILGLIPAGGGNDLAAALGLPQDPVQASRCLLDGEVRQIDAAKVRFMNGLERLYIGGGGVGLDAEASRYANAGFRNLPGRLRYVLAAIRALCGFHAFSVRVVTCSSEPTTVESKALLVGVLNTPSYGAGLYLAPNAQTHDGKLDLVLVEELSFREILAVLPALISRGELRTDRAHRFSAARIRIETELSRSFHGDGELLGVTPVEVSVVPGAIRILAPKSTRQP